MKLKLIWLSNLRIWPGNPILNPHPMLHTGFAVEFIVSERTGICSSDAKCMHAFLFPFTSLQLLLSCSLMRSFAMIIHPVVSYTCGTSLGCERHLSLDVDHVNVRPCYSQRLAHYAPQGKKKIYTIKSCRTSKNTLLSNDQGFLISDLFITSASTVICYEFWNIANFSSS